MSPEEREYWRTYTISDEQRRVLTPQQQRDLLEFARKMANGEIPPAVVSEDRTDHFDASGMVPVNGPPPPWHRRR